jgi:D-alanyl-D-alanine dipeptidase
MNTSKFPAPLQLLVVVTRNWSAMEGTLFCYQRSSLTLPWECVGAAVTVKVGRHGMAWGRGILHDQSVLPKKEGDGKSPAGLFSLGSVFGDAEHKLYAKNMPYLLITEDLECVDDPKSLHYNQFATSSFPKNRDWSSSEKMKEIGHFYALGIVVEHNLHPIQTGMGSAIFMHIWRKEGIGTAGCTTMEERDLQNVVAWLNKEANPLLVQLPMSEYQNKKSMWDLPEIT